METTEFLKHIDKLLNDEKNLTENGVKLLKELRVGIESATTREQYLDLGIEFIKIIAYYLIDS